MNPHAINVFTDGSAKPNPGKSGEGIVIVYPDGFEHEIIPDGYKVSTSIRTELMACVDALKFLNTDAKAKDIYHVCIHSDSQYVVDGYSMMRSGYRQRTKWEKSDGNDVDNKALWKDLERECRKIKKRVEVFKVKAHSGVVYNETADKLADKSRANAIRNDFFSEKSQVRRYLKLPDNVEGDKGLPDTVTVFIVGTNPRQKQYEMRVQVIRPIRYIGYKVILRANIENQPVRGAHIYKLNIRKKKGAYVVLGKPKDFGKSSENKHLFEKYSSNKRTGK